MSDLFQTIDMFVDCKKALLYSCHPHNLKGEKTITKSFQGLKKNVHASGGSVPHEKEVVLKGADGTRTANGCD